MYNYAIPFAIAKSSLEVEEAMVEDVVAEVVVFEATATYLVSVSAPAATLAPALRRQRSRGKGKSRDKGKDKAPVIVEQRPLSLPSSINPSYINFYFCQRGCTWTRGGT